MHWDHPRNVLSFFAGEEDDIKAARKNGQF
jgi:hypothetical protein